MPVVLEAFLTGVFLAAGVATIGATGSGSYSSTAGGSGSSAAGGSGSSSTGSSGSYYTTGVGGFFFTPPLFPFAGGFGFSCVFASSETAGSSYLLDMAHLGS